MNPSLAAIINEVRANMQRPSAANLTAKSRLREDLGFKSLDLAELTVRIEEKFGVDVFADGLVNTVGEIQVRISCATR